MKSTLSTELAFILQPIAGQSPVGPDLFSSGSLQDIDAALGRYGGDVGRACELAENYLAKKSKDLRCATRYVLARLFRDRYEGLCFALDVIAKLIEDFGDGIHPIKSWQHRAQLLNGTDSGLVKALQSIPLLPPGTTLPAAPQDRTKLERAILAASLDYYTNAVGHLNRSATVIVRIGALLGEKISSPVEIPFSVFPGLSAEIEKTVDRIEEIIARKNSADDNSTSGDVPRAAPTGDALPASAQKAEDEPILNDQLQAGIVDQPAEQKDEHSEQETNPIVISPIIAAARKLAASEKYDEAQKLVADALPNAAEGRAKFSLKFTLAEICIEAGEIEVANELLRGCVAELEKRSLFDWEPVEFLLPVLTALYHSQVSSDERRQAFARICQLAPATAIEMMVQKDR